MFETHAAAYIFISYTIKDSEMLKITTPFFSLDPRDRFIPFDRSFDTNVFWYRNFSGRSYTYITTYYSGENVDKTGVRVGWKKERVFRSNELPSVVGACFVNEKKKNNN